MRQLIESVGAKTPAGLCQRLGQQEAAARVFQRGFTLIELVMVIALAGAVGVMVASALSRPLEGFVAQSRRAALVDLAAGALNRMARDIRLAVPNSVRLNGNLANPAIEMFSVLNAGRYRPNRLGGDGLQFATGRAPACTANFAAVSAGQGDCTAFQALATNFSISGARWLVLYNIGAESDGTPLAGSNLWAPTAAGVANVISPDGSTFAAAALAGNETLISMTPPGGSFNFAYASPQRRFYLADQIVGYRCDANGQLIRFTRTARTPSFAGSNAADEALQANNVTACSMTYQAGSTQRAGLVTLRLQLTLEGESIELLQQVHVDNAP